MLVRTLALAAVLAVLEVLQVVANPARAADPKVPPGQDPGGTAIALIGGGLDYTRQAIAARLARDGEGELIGWDMVDNDRTPFAAPAPAAADAKGANPTALAELTLASYSKGRLVPLRVPEGDAQALAKAIAFTAGTPARIVGIAMPVDSTALRTVVRQASQRFRDHLFVVAGDVTSPPSKPGQGAGETPQPNLMNLANVLVVAALSDAGGKPVDQVIAASEILVQPRTGSMFGGLVGGGPPRDGREAVAMAIAAAACQGHGRQSPLHGSAAKAAVLDAARPLPDTPAVRALDPMCWYGGVRY